MHVLFLKAKKVKPRKKDKGKAAALEFDSKSFRLIVIECHVFNAS